MELVQYDVRDRIAHVTIANGKANALSFEVLAGLDDALSRAEDAGEAEVGSMLISGAPGMLSGGFDLQVMRSGAEAAGRLVTDGGELFSRMYGRRCRWSWPAPVTRSRRGRCCCSVPTRASARAARSGSA